MKILVGCEESGIVREAFRKRGHEAWSNDIQDCSDNSPFHLKMDVMKAIDVDEWDIIILHPECRYMALSGNRHYAGTELRENAINWTVELWSKAKHKVKIGCAMENPRSALWRYIPDRKQTIHPWQFGHAELKPTMLALHNLPELRETNNVKKILDELTYAEKAKIHYMSPSPDRSKLRSKTYQGIAEAFAEQWG